MFVFTLIVKDKLIQLNICVVLNDVMIVKKRGIGMNADSEKRIKDESDEITEEFLAYYAQTHSPLKPCTQHILHTTHCLCSKVLVKTRSHLCTQLLFFCTNVGLLFFTLI